MTAIDFGVTIRPTPRGGTSEMRGRTSGSSRRRGARTVLLGHRSLPVRRPADPRMPRLPRPHGGALPGLRWGTLVLGQGYRNPALTAKIAATLAVPHRRALHPRHRRGREEDEYLAYGYRLPSARERIEQLDEAAQIITRALAGRPGHLHRRALPDRGRLLRAATDPPPMLMIGGGGEQRTLRVVAEHADWWNADYYSPAEYARKLGVLHEHCRAIGRDPAAIVPTCYMGDQPLARSRPPRPAARRWATAARSTSSAAPRTR